MTSVCSENLSTVREKNNDDNNNLCDYNTKMAPQDDNTFESAGEATCTDKIDCTTLADVTIYPEDGGINSTSVDPMLTSSQTFSRFSSIPSPMSSTIIADRSTKQGISELANQPTVVFLPGQQSFSAVVMQQTMSAFPDQQIISGRPNEQNASAIPNQQTIFSPPYNRTVSILPDQQITYTHLDSQPPAQQTVLTVQQLEISKDICTETRPRLRSVKFTDPVVISCRTNSDVISSAASNKANVSTVKHENISARSEAKDLPSSCNQTTTSRDPPAQKKPIVPLVNGGGTAVTSTVQSRRTQDVETSLQSDVVTGDTIANDVVEKLTSQRAINHVSGIPQPRYKLRPIMPVFQAAVSRAGDTAAAKVVTGTATAGKIAMKNTNSAVNGVVNNGIVNSGVNRVSRSQSASGRSTAKQFVRDPPSAGSTPRGVEPAHSARTSSGQRQLASSPERRRSGDETNVDAETAGVAPGRPGLESATRVLGNTGTGNSRVLASNVAHMRSGSLGRNMRIPRTNITCLTSSYSQDDDTPTDQFDADKHINGITHLAPDSAEKRFIHPSIYSTGLVGRRETVTSEAENQTSSRRVKMSTSVSRKDKFIAVVQPNQVDSLSSSYSYRDGATAAAAEAAAALAAVGKTAAAVNATATRNRGTSASRTRGTFANCETSTSVRHDRGTSANRERGTSASRDGGTTANRERGVSVTRERGILTTTNGDSMKNDARTTDSKNQRQRECSIDRVTSGRERLSTADVGSVTGADSRDMTSAWARRRGYDPVKSLSRSSSCSRTTKCQQQVGAVLRGDEDKNCGFGFDVGTGRSDVRGTRCDDVILMRQVTNDEKASSLQQMEYDYTYTVQCHDCVKFLQKDAQGKPAFDNHYVLSRLQATVGASAPAIWHRSAFTAPVISKSQSAPLDASSVSHSNESRNVVQIEAPKAIKNPCDSILVDSIQHFSRKLESLTDQLIQRMRDGSGQPIAVSSADDSLLALITSARTTSSMIAAASIGPGDWEGTVAGPGFGSGAEAGQGVTMPAWQNASPELAAILDHLRRTEQRLQLVVQKTVLNPTNTDTSTAAVTEDNHQQTALSSREERDTSDRGVAKSTVSDVAMAKSAIIPSHLSPGSQLSTEQLQRLLAEKSGFKPITIPTT